MQSSGRLITLLVILSLAGCGPKRYFGRGLVLDVSPETNTVTVSHDRIPKYMEPMVMPFRVRDAALLRGVEPGDSIHFRLAIDGTRSYLDHLTVVSAAPVDPALWQAPVRSRVVAPGEEVPDFRLIDQNGDSVSLAQFRGKVVAVTFIYTRCPLPDYCPRMTRNFSELSRRFRNRLGDEVVLLSVTLDPQFDTPEVLRRYAQNFDARQPGWYFLTGPREEIARVCGFFGVEFWPEEGMITHNLRTGLVDRQGRLAAHVEGKSYSGNQLGDLVERLLGK